MNPASWTYFTILDELRGRARAQIAILENLGQKTVITLQLLKRLHIYFTLETKSDTNPAMVAEQS